MPTVGAAAVVSKVSVAGEDDAPPTLQQASHCCKHCNTKFGSRTQLFKHLRGKGALADARCTRAAGMVTGLEPQRVMLVVSFIGGGAVRALWRALDAERMAVFGGDERGDRIKPMSPDGPPGLRSTVDLSRHSAASVCLLSFSLETGLGPGNSDDFAARINKRIIAAEAAAAASTTTTATSTSSSAPPQTLAPTPVGVTVVASILSPPGFDAHTQCKYRRYEVLVPLPALNVSAAELYDGWEAQCCWNATQVLDSWRAPLHKSVPIPAQPPGVNVDSSSTTAPAEVASPSLHCQAKMQRLWQQLQQERDAGADAELCASGLAHDEASHQQLCAVGLMRRVEGLEVRVPARGLCLEWAQRLTEETAGPWISPCVLVDGEWWTADKDSWSSAATGRTEVPQGQYDMLSMLICNPRYTWRRVDLARIDMAASNDDAAAAAAGDSSEPQPLRVGATVRGIGFLERNIQVANEATAPNSSVLSLGYVRVWVPSAAFVEAEARAARPKEATTSPPPPPESSVDMAAAAAAAGGGGGYGGDGGGDGGGDLDASAGTKPQAAAKSSCRGRGLGHLGLARILKGFLATLQGEHYFHNFGGLSPFHRHAHHIIGVARCNGCLWVSPLPPPPAASLSPLSLGAHEASDTSTATPPSNTITPTTAAATAMDMGAGPGTYLVSMSFAAYRFHPGELEAIVGLICALMRTPSLPAEAVLAAAVSETCILTPPRAPPFLVCLKDADYGCYEHSKHVQVLPRWPPLHEGGVKTVGAFKSTLQARSDVIRAVTAWSNGGGASAWGESVDKAVPALRAEWEQWAHSRAETGSERAAAAASEQGRAEEAAGDERATTTTTTAAAAAAADGPGVSSSANVGSAGSAGDTKAVSTAASSDEPSTTHKDAAAVSAAAAAAAAAASHLSSQQALLAQLEPAPSAYREVLALLHGLDASGRWPGTSVARRKRIDGPAGDSFTMGVMPSRLQRPLSNAAFPRLMAATFRLERALLPHRPPSTTIVVNRRARFKPHTDSGAGAGQAISAIVGLGDYTGGDLVVEGQTHNIRYNAIEFDGWKQRHWTLPFQGCRFSLVWFTPEGCERSQLDHELKESTAAAEASPL